MGQHSETEATILKARVAELTLERRYPHEIAKATGLSVDRVRRLQRELRDEYNAAAHADTKQMIRQRLRELEHLEREAYAAWHRSQAEKKSLEVKTKHVHGVAVQDTKAKKQGRDGDRGFLTALLAILKEKSKLESLYASDRTKDDEELTPGEQRTLAIRGMFSRLVDAGRDDATARAELLEMGVTKDDLAEAL